MASAGSDQRSQWKRVIKANWEVRETVSAQTLKDKGLARPSDLQKTTALLLGRGCSLREDPEKTRKETAHRKQFAEAPAQRRQVGTYLPVTPF